MVALGALLILAVSLLLLQPSTAGSDPNPSQLDHVLESTPLKTTLVAKDDVILSELGDVGREASPTLRRGSVAYGLLVGQERMKYHYRRLTTLHDDAKSVLEAEDKARKALASACAQCGHPVLTVATFNLWGKEHMWGIRRDRIVKLISKLNPSILGLQEVSVKAILLAVTVVLTQLRCIVYRQAS